MSSRKDHENMDKLDSCYKLVQQSSAKGGIKAVEIAEKLGFHKTTIYDQLNSLQFAGKVYSDQGLWKATTGEQTIKPLEKEIVIELPIPKDLMVEVSLLEIYAKHAERKQYSWTAEIFKILLEKLRETRTIKIKGKNVDDLDLEKLGNLIKQANKKSSKVDLKGLFKSLKKSRPHNSQGQRN